VKRIILAALIFSSFNLAFADNLKLADLKVKNSIDMHRSMTSQKSEQTFFTTKTLAWTTVALLGATALTGRERKVNPIHVSLASLSLLSYGAFIHSYFTNQEVSGTDGRKTYRTASYSKWLHIPAMLVLPIAGAIAQRQYEKKGQTSATGFAKLHKPAALAAVAGMALSTLSLTFEF